MLKTLELAMPRTNKVTTVYNGRREVWTDYEDAKSYFLEMMMSTEGEEHDRAECVYIQLLHGLNECSDEENKQKRSVPLMVSAPFFHVMLLHQHDSHSYHVIVSLCRNLPAVQFNDFLCDRKSKTCAVSVCP